MSTVYGASAPSFATVKRWSRKFKHGRESLKDDPRPGRPNTAVTEENIEKVKKLVLEDRRFKLWHLAEAIGISKDRIGAILHNHLHMKKVCARWVPKMFTPLDKQRLVTTSQEFLDICGDNPDDVFSRLVTVDET
ncbi:protein GVQW3-like [Pectinophora gossypiella]|uniref:protein GVQW3-like n=1 Tax=Pectinophora gossypiella TaxID=13191 RepID=UPI00214F50C0|nr:protein GVQW3-like [Pectinophora gossypiella]